MFLQLSQIEKALEIAKEKDKLPLQELQLNLLELLELTLQQLQEKQKNDKSEDNTPKSVGDKMDEEFALFKVCA